MTSKSRLQRVGLASRWFQELVLAALALVLGFAVMPVLIYYVGIATLGPYEGASLPRMYDSLYQGLVAGSPASWIVVLGPYGLYLLFKILRRWWRTGTPVA